MNRTLSQLVGSSRIAAVITVLGTLLATGMVYPQSTEQPPPPIIGYGFDEFHIGGESVYHPGICSRQLNMDFTYHYGGYSSSTFMQDSSRWDSTTKRARVRGFRRHGQKVGAEERASCA